MRSRRSTDASTRFARLTTWRRDERCSRHWMSNPEDDESKVQLERFQVLESTVLAHHAFEALVRLYLAHAADTTCPWIEVAAETSFGAFKSRVNDEIIGLPADALAERMVPLVFLGSLELTKQQQTLVLNTANFLRFA